MHDMHQMAGPQAWWEYALVAGAVLVLVWVLYLAFKYTFRPGENEPGHIKRKILEGGAAARDTSKER